MPDSKQHRDAKQQAKKPGKPGKPGTHDKPEQPEKQVKQDREEPEQAETEGGIRVGNDNDLDEDSDQAVTQRNPRILDDDSEVE